MPQYFAFIPAGGSGTRMGAPAGVATPKQYLPVRGEPMIVHSARTLATHPRISHTWVVVAPDNELAEKALSMRLLGASAAGISIEKKGGATRALTVMGGLLAARAMIDDIDWVLVHDAARPGLTHAMIDRLIEGVGDHSDGGLLALPVADTLKRADASNRVDETISRTGLWAAQTPQMFRYGMLVEALQLAIEVTDEASAMEAAGCSPKLITGGLRNMKVTYADDIALVEKLMDLP
jgi:2-C-methyl-D-erythritol 4-phosphate cytidylyltransferase